MIREPRLLGQFPFGAGLRRTLSAATSLVGTLACAAIAWATAPVDFWPQIPYILAGSEPRVIRVDDLNLDHHLDLAVTSSTGAEVTVLLGDGLGHFNDDQPFDLPIAAWGLGVADFNHDQIPDLAVTDGSHDGTGVHIYLGDGEGGFALHGIEAAGNFPLAVAVGDYDEDGEQDLAVANNVLYGLSILFGDGTGNFSAPQHQPGYASMMALDLASGDLNNDTHLHLAISHYNGVTVFLGVGDGTFTPAGGVGSYYLNSAVDIGDLNGDNAADIVSIELYMEHLLVNLGNGDGTFQATQSYWVGYRVEDVLVADVNNDGAPDVLLPRDGAGMNDVLVFRGDGTGALMPARSFATGWGPTCVTVGDWNEDGYPDIAAPYRNLGETPYVSVMLQKPLGDLNCDGLVNAGDIPAFVLALTDPAAYAAAYPGCDRGLADINGDGTVNAGDIPAFVALLVGD